MGLETVLFVLLGVAAGTLGSLLGLGGGFLVVPALMLWREMNPRIATGTAVVVILASSLVTIWRRGTQGHIDWSVGAIVAVGGVVGAFLGSWLAGVVDPAWIRRIFAFVLAALALRLLLWP
jgi:uncharacterized membrane protein YfcA